MTMKIKIINPNTTQSMTGKIGEAATNAAAPGTEIVTVSPPMGPPSIEGHYDEVFATLGVVDEVRKGEAEGFDGYVIACFGDPGLFAAREIARGPVIGMAEAAMQAASIISEGFSIVSTLERGLVGSEHLVQRYGMQAKCRRARSTGLSVLDLEVEGSNARSVIVDECRRALEEDHSDCIVLGCAGMADLCRHISEQIGAPAIDGVTVGVKLAEGLISLGLGSSKRRGFAYPLPKDYIGSVSGYAPGPRH
jgi:allantoin racemase